MLNNENENKKGGVCQGSIGISPVENWEESERKYEEDRDLCYRMLKGLVDSSLASELKLYTDVMKEHLSSELNREVDDYTMTRLFDLATIVRYLRPISPSKRYFNGRRVPPRGNGYSVPSGVRDREGCKRQRTVSPVSTPKSTNNADVGVCVDRLCEDFKKLSLEITSFELNEEVEAVKSDIRDFLKNEDEKGDEKGDEKETDAKEENSNSPNLLNKEETEKQQIDTLEKQGEEKQGEEKENEQNSPKTKKEEEDHPVGELAYLISCFDPEDVSQLHFEQRKKSIIISSEELELQNDESDIVVRTIKHLHPVWMPDKQQWFVLKKIIKKQMVATLESNDVSPRSNKVSPANKKKVRV